ncbi:MAG: hypothetical protein ACE5GY_10880 [Thermodesulfobacteriota bacterium]
MKMKLVAGVLTAVVGLFFGSAADATLCKPRYVNQRHQDEAARLAGETYAQGVYAGSKDYDARVIGCNRHRDDKGREIEKKLTAGHRFPGNLSPKLVRGHIRYYNLVPMRYGYQVARKGGEWVVTVPVKFHFPKKLKKRLDIPMELARRLGIDRSVCSTTRRKGGRIIRGHISASKKGKRYEACRVNRNERFNATPVTTHLMEFWRSSIEGFWSRPGFKVDVKIENLGEIKPALLKKYNERNIVWQVRMNHKNNRAMYKASVGRPHPLYAGLPGRTIVHEFGHAMGLDDEYPERVAVLGRATPTWRKCNSIGGNQYIMCNLGTGLAKGVYPWIVTRRYMIGTQDKASSRRRGRTKEPMGSGRPPIRWRR